MAGEKSGTKTESALRCIDKASAGRNSCILFCSLGKDSIVTLDLIYGRFERIVCVYLYFVKGLEHIERWIRWVRKRYPRVEFIQLPHWTLTYIMRMGLYCVQRPGQRLIRLRDIVSVVRKRTGIDMVFFGMKKADGINRRLMLRGYEKYSYVFKDCAYPLAEWTQKDVLAYMRHHKLPAPGRYSFCASSGIGFGEDCLLWMREHEPEDLERFLRVFPLAERILWKAENRAGENGDTGTERGCPDPGRGSM